MQTEKVWQLIKAETSGNYFLGVTMPIMIRSKLSAKIAFSILGKPANLSDKQSSLQKKISKSMQSQDTRLVR